MKNMFGIVLIALWLASGSVQAQRSPLPGRNDRPRFDAAISGTVQLVDCNASPANVRITAGTRSVQPRPVEGNDFLWSYTLTGITPGTYTVTASLDRGWCARGSWSPATHRVTLESSLAAVGNINFQYQGRRDVTRINASVLASLIENAFRGTVVHLNNYNPRRHAFSGRDSWHRQDDCSITLGGTATPFSLEEISEGPLRYYVRDFNLSRVVVRPETDAFLLSFQFENRGPVEIKGHCSNTTASIDLACPAGSDSTAPDFEINAAHLDVRLVPVRNAQGDLTYGPIRVTFDASVQGGGLGNIFETRVKGSIKSKVEDIVGPLLDAPALRRNVARALRPTLDRVGVGSVVAVRFDRGDLVIDSYPR